MDERLEDLLSYLYRERDKYSKEFNADMVRILTGYINALKDIRSVSE